MVLARRIWRGVFAVSLGLLAIGWLIGRTQWGQPRPILTIAVETSSPWDLAFSPDAKYLAFVDYVAGASQTRQTLRVVEVPSGKVKAVLDGVSASFAWNQDGSLVAVASADGGEIWIYNTHTWIQEQQIAVRKLEPGGELVVANVAFGQDNSLFATEGFTNRRRARESPYRALAWRCIHGRYSESPIVLAGGDGRNVLSLAVGNVSGETRVVVGFDSRDIDILRVSDLGGETWKVRKEYSVASQAECYLALSRNGEVLITLGSLGGQVFHLSEHAWLSACAFGRPVTSGGHGPLSPVRRDDYLYRAVKLSDDGRLGVCKDGYSPLLLDCSTCVPLLRFAETTGGNTISGDGLLMATGSDRSIRVYRVTSRE